MRRTTQTDRPPHGLSSLVPWLAIAGALRRDRELVFDFVAKGRIHRFRPAERGFLGNVIELHHFTKKRILPWKIMRNGAGRHRLQPLGCRACPRS